MNALVDAIDALLEGFDLVEDGANPEIEISPNESVPTIYIDTYIDTALTCIFDIRRYLKPPHSYRSCNESGILIRIKNCEVYEKDGCY